MTTPKKTKNSKSSAKTKELKSPPKEKKSKATNKVKEPEMGEVTRMDSKDGRTTLLVHLTGNLLAFVVVKITSSHIDDKWTFQRGVGLPSLIDSRRWDEMGGEKYCITLGTKDQAIASAQADLKELCEWLGHKI